MSYWDHIVRCNQFRSEGYVPFVFSDTTSLGWIRRDRVPLVADFNDVFEFDACKVIVRTGDDVTTHLDRVCQHLQGQGHIQNWRGERYGVKRFFAQPPLFEIERAATPFFGIGGFGVHLNGFVRKADGLYMWIARRAADRYICPDKLDNIVAGGQPVGLSLRENLLKECAEEAAIPVDVAQKARPVGAIRYCMETPDGVKPDTIFCYDLELDEAFIPQNTDGEVASFTLMPIEEVAEIVRTGDDFKFNCNLVIIDFLIRHGLITADQEPDYERLMLGLQGQLV